LEKEEIGGVVGRCEWRWNSKVYYYRKRRKEKHI